jgi:hypothetical protein
MGDFKFHRLGKHPGWLQYITDPEVFFRSKTLDDKQQKK